MRALPRIVDYQTAASSPGTWMLDEELRSLEAERDRNGDPLVYSGGFAATFRLRARHGPGVAVRCFLKPDDELAERYAAIERFLESVDHPWWASTRYIEQGVRPPGWETPLPIVRMDWVKGLTLEKWLQENGGDRPRV